jgi:hypothetical protein
VTSNSNLIQYQVPPTTRGNCNPAYSAPIPTRIRYDSCGERWSNTAAQAGLILLHERKHHHFARPLALFSRGPAAGLKRFHETASPEPQVLACLCIVQCGDVTPVIMCIVYHLKALPKIFRERYALRLRDHDASGGRSRGVAVCFDAVRFQEIGVAVQLLLNLPRCQHKCAYCIKKIV